MHYKFQFKLLWIISPSIHVRFYHELVNLKPSTSDQTINKNSVTEPGLQHVGRGTGG